jgi:hypothetical protein
VGGLGVGVEIILKGFFKNIMVRCGMDSTGTRQGGVVDFNASVMNLSCFTEDSWSVELAASKKKSHFRTVSSLHVTAVGAKLKINTTSLLKAQLFGSCHCDTSRAVASFFKGSHAHALTHPKRPCETGDTHRLHTQFCTAAIPFTSCLHRNSSLNLIYL